jgi:hypothetical protein
MKRYGLAAILALGLMALSQERAAANPWFDYYLGVQQLGIGMSAGLRTCPGCWSLSIGHAAYPQCGSGGPSCYPLIYLSSPNCGNGYAGGYGGYMTGPSYWYGH